MKRLAPVFLASIVLGSLLPTSGVRAQTVTSSQTPCVPIADNYCTTFTHNSGPGPILTIRAFSFNAPSAGKALVTFHGTLYCAAAPNTTAGVAVISQITTTAAGAPVFFGPGGLHHNIDFRPSSLGTSYSFNLASTRVVNIAGPGLNTFYFKIDRHLMDEGPQCYVYNSAFTVVFTP